MNPFFCLDRPNALEILKGVQTHTDFGILTHPRISDNLKNQLRETDIEIICDSGQYNKQRNIDSYPQLFHIYDEIGADYGLIFDKLDSYTDRAAMERTLYSAQSALEHYELGDYSFDLVGVVQGWDYNSYLLCAEHLLDMGYERLAVGGLLKQRGDSNYAKVGDETEMYQILRGIREKFGDGWLFALGCWHPKRKSKFEALDLYGADSKRWIYQYQDPGNRYRETRKHVENIVGVSEQTSLAQWRKAPRGNGGALHEPDKSVDSGGVNSASR